MRATHPITRPDSLERPRASQTRPVAAAGHEAVKTALDAFSAHDLDGPADVLADDVVCRAPGGVEAKGKAACVEFHRRWLADFPDGRAEVRARHMTDHVVVEIRDGEQVSLDLTFDRLVMLEQLGLV